MNVIRPALLVAVALTGALVPQIPLQASELVKLGRLIVTGKRAPVPAVVEEPKLTTAARPLADAPERPTATVRSQEASAEIREAREVRESANVVQTERVTERATEPAGKPPLERNGSSGTGTSSTGVGAGAGAGGERSEPFFSFKSLLRGF